GLISSIGLLYVGTGVEPPAPVLCRRLALWRAEKVLQRNVEEGPARLSEGLVAVDDLPGDVNSPSALVLDMGADQQLGVDRHGPAKVHEQPRGDRREAVPRGEQPAGLVQSRSDETAVD